jgi:hypothetical protein
MSRGSARRRFRCRIREDGRAAACQRSSGLQLDRSGELTELEASRGTLRYELRVRERVLPQEPFRLPLQVIRRSRKCAWSMQIAQAGSITSSTDEM